MALLVKQQQTTVPLRSSKMICLN